MTTYCGRLAPSPTGALHLGNARTFLIAWLRARTLGGRIVLRMEDLDHPKVKPETVHQAYEDLHWLGLDWDEGPTASQPLHVTPGADNRYIQSRRLPFYHEALQRLREQGRIYPCICTRKDIESAQSAPHAEDEMRYPGTCRDRFACYEDALTAAKGRPPAWRFRVPDKISYFHDNFRSTEHTRLYELGDFVVARGDQAGYQLAVVLDDAAMQITEVVRADDLLASTHRQLLLYIALELAPPAFLHVPLVIGPDGKRLAKRHGDTRIAAMRVAGTPPGRILGWLAHSCGWAEAGVSCTLEEVQARFRLDTISKRPIVLSEADQRHLGVPTA